MSTDASLPDQRPRCLPPRHACNKRCCTHALVHIEACWPRRPSPANAAGPTRQASGRTGTVEALSVRPPQRAARARPASGHCSPLGEEAEPSLPPPPPEEEIIYRRRKGHGWSKLPENLQREEVLLDVPEERAALWRPVAEPMQKIGEDRSERVNSCRPGCGSRSSCGPSMPAPAQQGASSKRRPRRRRCRGAV